VGQFGRNAEAPGLEEKAPKGESQERCRSETSSARLAEEKTVKRVVKP
jgi:hypothetical protein